MTEYWHKVSEKEKQEISRQAKKIMDNFAKALEKVEKEAEVEEGQEKIKEIEEGEENTRQEKETEEPDKEFRKIFLENAPEEKENCIVAEKKKW